MSTQRVEILGDTMRRLARRGARRNLSRVLSKVRPGDVAAALRKLVPTEQLFVVRLALEDFPDSAGEVLLELEPGERRPLLEELAPSEIAGLLSPLAVDDSVEIVDGLEDELREAVLALLDRPDRDELQTQFAYEEDTAGRIMNTEFFSLPEDTSVGDAIAKIREHGEVEMIFYLYVVDPEGRLVGVLSLRELLLSVPSRALGEIMNRGLVTATTDTDQEEVAQLASRYDFLAIPVVDEGRRLLGLVTVDDVIDIVQEEAEEDFYKMVGTSDDELLYRERAWRVAGIRLPWLLVNLIGLTLTGVLMKQFQLRLNEAFLLAFAPVVMGMGGNIGSQTMTLTVRGLATGRIGEGGGRMRRFLFQQIRIGLVVALVCAAVAAAVAAFLEQNPAYSAVVASSLFLAIVLASLIGSLLPMAFERMGIDPAIASGPMVTTSSDITGILVYFGLATLMIDWLVR